jgi:hypothetical protein
MAEEELELLVLPPALLEEELVPPVPNRDVLEEDPLPLAVLLLVEVLLLLLLLLLLLREGGVLAEIKALLIFFIELKKLSSSKWELKDKNK